MIIIIVLLLILYLRFITNFQIENFAGTLNVGGCKIKWSRPSGADPVGKPEISGNGDKGQCLNRMVANWTAKQGEHARVGAVWGVESVKWLGNESWDWLDDIDIVKETKKLTNLCSHAKELNKIDWNPDVNITDEDIAVQAEDARLRFGLPSDKDWVGYPGKKSGEAAGMVDDPRGVIYQTTQECREYAKKKGYPGVGYRQAEKTCFFFKSPNNIIHHIGFQSPDDHHVGCTDPDKSWGDCPMDQEADALWNTRRGWPNVAAANFVSDSRGGGIRTLQDCRTYARKQGYPGVGYRTRTSHAQSHGSCYFYKNPNDAPYPIGFKGYDDNYVGCTDPHKPWGSCRAVTAEEQQLAEKAMSASATAEAEEDKAALTAAVEETLSALQGASKNKNRRGRFTQEISVRDVNDDCTNIATVIGEIIIAIPQLIKRSINFNAIFGAIDDAIKDVVDKSNEVTKICGHIKKLNRVEWGNDIDGNPIVINKIKGNCSNLVGVLVKIVDEHLPLLLQQIGKAFTNAADLFTFCTWLKAINDEGKLKKVDKNGNSKDNGTYNSLGLDNYDPPKHMVFKRVNDDCSNLEEVLRSLITLLPKVASYIKEVPKVLNAKWEEGKAAMCRDIVDPLEDHIRAKYKEDELNSDRFKIDKETIEERITGNWCTTDAVIIVLTQLLLVESERVKRLICDTFAGAIDKEIDSGAWTKKERTRNYPYGNWGGEVALESLKERGFKNLHKSATFQDFNLYYDGRGRYVNEDALGNITPAVQYYPRSKSTGTEAPRAGFSVNDFRGVPPPKPGETDEDLLDGKAPDGGPQTCENIGPIITIMMAVYIDRGATNISEVMQAMFREMDTFFTETLPGLIDDIPNVDFKTVVNEDTDTSSSGGATTTSQAS